MTVNPAADSDAHVTALNSALLRFDAAEYSFMRPCAAAMTLASNS